MGAIINEEKAGQNYLRIFCSLVPAPPLRAAGRVFADKFGVEVDLTAGKPEGWAPLVIGGEAGDVICCGAEYLLDEFEDAGAIIKESRRTVGYRRSVLIVAPDNPKGITSLADLTRPEVRVGIAVGGCPKGIWDDICSKAGLTDAVRRNIVVHADGCGSLIRALTQGEIDVGFGWSSFCCFAPQNVAAVELSRDLQVYRSTSVAITSFSPRKELARQFIEFLVTAPEARKFYDEFEMSLTVPPPT
ncbi:MAG TPA: ABC transporter substrate-binding protein [Armatimonadetes bacterium]|nr:ABC transporter substrate-binding protein [Armatimonadota bacterium]